MFFPFMCFPFAMNKADHAEIWVTVSGKAKRPGRVRVSLDTIWYIFVVSTLFKVSQGWETDPGEKMNIQSLLIFFHHIMRPLVQLHYRPLYMFFVFYLLTNRVAQDLQELMKWYENGQKTVSMVLRSSCKNVVSSNPDFLPPPKDMATLK